MFVPIWDNGNLIANINDVLDLSWDKYLDKFMPFAISEVEKHVCLGCFQYKGICKEEFCDFAHPLSEKISLSISQSKSLLN